MDRPIFVNDEAAMRYALEQARRGIGHVEPNPAVGAVIVDEQGELVSSGFHQKFGGPHAEVEALRQADRSVQGMTVYVTLEPCSHFGKTPPCADALVAAGVGRVVVATVDPAPHVAGTGISRLREYGIRVDVGICQAEADVLIAPFRKLFTQGLPFVHAKWAMTLDGKIASRTGSSKWITNATSRARVHQLRGRMDAMISGIGTVLADDPLLTVRPPGARTPTRVILDSTARLPLDSQLVASAAEAPVLLFTLSSSSTERIDLLRERGVEVFTVPPCEDSGLVDHPEQASPPGIDLKVVLQELGERKMTNVLIEAGGRLLGAFWDENLIDEVHCFIAPRLIGGATALSPLSGLGIESMEQSVSLTDQQVELLDGDIYVCGRLPAN